MKYVYNGEYREFRGRIFLKGVPVEITDKGTLDAIKHEPDFTEVPDEKAQEQAPDTAPVLEPEKPKGKECAVCHKLIPRGWYMHQKYCKG